MKDHGARFFFQRIQMLPAAFPIDREETLKGEPPGGQTADSQSVDGGAAAGNGPDFHAVFRTQPHQILTGIGDGRGAGVRYQSAGFSPQQPAQDSLPGGDVVVFVVAYQRLFDAEMVQQLYGHAGVLRGNKIRVFQGLCRPRRKISQIADGGSDQI